MKKLITHKYKLFQILDVVKFILIFILFLMFISFNKEIAQQGANTQALTQSTNKVVKSQGDILNAIKQVTDDTRITAAEQTAIIICMLQVPITQRTTDLQTECREQASVSNAGNGEETSRSSTGASSGAGAGAASLPSSQRSTNQNNPQSDSSQDDFTPVVPEPAQPIGFLDLVLSPLKNIVNGL